MMQSAESWRGNDSIASIGVLHCNTTSRRSLQERKMCPIFVVVTDVVFHEPFQMPHIEDDHVVEQVPAAIANPTLCDTVLPRTSEAGSLRLDAEVLYCIDNFIIEIRAAVKDQVAGG